MDAANQSASAAAHSLSEVLGAAGVLSGVAGASLPSGLTSQPLPGALNTPQTSVQSAASIPYLPWPPQQPSINVPFFDTNLYKSVNLDAQPSCLPNGMDLPLSDITTLRFFFNMGVNHARAVLLSHHVQQALTSLQPQQSNTTHMQSLVSVAPVAPQNPIGISTTALHTEQLQLLNQFRAQQNLAQQKLSSAEKLRDAQQHTAKTHVSIPSKTHASSLQLPFISAASSLTAPIEALLLQNALLTNNNGNRGAIDLAQLRYQLALGATAQGLLGTTSTNGAPQTSSHELLKPIPVSVSDVSNPQANGSISPRPPIPVDPAPQSETALERTLRLVQQGSVAAQQLNELQQQAILSLRQPVDSASALQAAQIAVAAAAGQQATRDTAHAQQMPGLLSSGTPRQPSTSPAVHPFVPCPIRPTPTHAPVQRDEVPPSHSLLAVTEMHYNETFKNTHGLIHESSEPRNGATVAPREQASTAKPSVPERKSAEPDEQRNPAAMINLLNGVLSKVKSELHHQGVGVHLDAVGRPIDFSARPVDPIFRRAREQLENSREYRDATSPSAQAHHAISVERGVRRPSLKEADVVRLASERLQNSAAVTKPGVSASCETSLSPTSKSCHPAEKSSPLGCHPAEKSSPIQIAASSSDSALPVKPHHDRRPSDSPPKSRQSPCIVTTSVAAVSTDSEESKTKDEKTEGNNTNDKSMVDEYDGGDYSPSEKRLRIASTEEE